MLANLNYQLPAPFNASDLDPPCTDVPGTIGITGTPVIKRSTNTMYFWAKGYKGAVGGFSNGAYVSKSCREVVLDLTLTECPTRYFFYAIDALSLADRAGYPVLIDGNPADNVCMTLENFTNKS